jgi:nucleotide-binding universal stress UspA family protein
MEIQINSILCPTDFSECAEHALNYAELLSEICQARLQLLTVFEPFTYSQGSELFESQYDMASAAMEIEAAFKKQLNDRVSSLESNGRNVSAHFAVGLPFIEIIQAAKRENADLMIMGTHGRTGLEHVLMGSVAEKVVRRAPCPVLTVKHPDHKFKMP